MKGRMGVPVRLLLAWMGALCGAAVGREADGPADARIDVDPCEPWDPFAPPNPLPRSMRGRQDPERKPLSARSSTSDAEALARAAEKRRRRGARNLALDHRKPLETP